MAVVKSTADDVAMLARLLRAEAEGEGEQGMLMVGNVGVNRVRVDCSDFKNVRTIRQMIFQSPGGFEAVQKPYFYQRAREKEKRLAKRVINGERIHPATYSLWYFRPEGNCPNEWWGQPFVARFKAHCFYQPSGATCSDVYNTY
ncbi:cell wall hydrolase [Ammoniphilus resinae]|uniref:N-acetylmuramoyl-L-alanine amidase n=1 Tax=Ammoniphilus resinae TaxID=861532 RepID=A0ABS4GNT7_9BACL|nr:cell wall hydrolase [Ammoniphilus resinae]MBP1931717.1 N-acetylmuramoyl-L-alanine amidase [Ammoniphilus resinae]